MACPLEAYSTPLQKHTVNPKRPHPRPTSTLRTCRAAANWIRTGLLSEKEVDDLLGLLFEHELAYVRHLLQFPLPKRIDQRLREHHAAFSDAQIDSVFLVRCPLRQHLLHLADRHARLQIAIAEEEDARARQGEQAKRGREGSPGREEEGGSPATRTSTPTTRRRLEPELERSGLDL